MEMRVKKLIIYLIRKKLGLQMGEFFRFVNQKDKSVYHFTKHYLVKQLEKSGKCVLSGVSLNWLLNDDCEIVRVGDYELMKLTSNRKAVRSDG